jgi:hypothetical protein
MRGLFSFFIGCSTASTASSPSSSATSAIIVYYLLITRAYSSSTFSSSTTGKEGSDCIASSGYCLSIFLAGSGTYFLGFRE